MTEPIPPPRIWSYIHFLILYSRLFVAPEGLYAEDGHLSGNSAVSNIFLL